MQNCEMGESTTSSPFIYKVLISLLLYSQYPVNLILFLQLIHGLNHSNLSLFTTPSFLCFLVVDIW